MGGIAGAEIAEVQDIVHVADEDGPLLPVEDGEPVESFEADGTIVVFAGVDFMAPQWQPLADQPEDVSSYDQFGYIQQLDDTLLERTAVTVGAFSTPKAEEGDEVLNPVAEMAAGDLLATDRGRNLLRESGILAAMEIDHPEDVEFVGFVEAGRTDVQWLDGDSSLESYAGILRDGDVLRLAVVHVARAEVGSDVAFLAGAQQRTLWSAEGEAEFGTDHVDTIVDGLADADLQSLLLDGADPPVTPAGIEASVGEVVTVAPEFDRVES